MFETLIYKINTHQSKKIITKLVNRNQKYTDSFVLFIQLFWSLKLYKNTKISKNILTSVEKYMNNLLAREKHIWVPFISLTVSFFFLNTSPFFDITWIHFSIFQDSDWIYNIVSTKN